MASNLNDKTTEILTREELIKELTRIKSLLSSKDRMIQGQNYAIQTLTAQNFMFRDLLKKVLNLKSGLFCGTALAGLQSLISDKLKERLGKGQSFTEEQLIEQNVTLRDIVEQLLNLQIGLFSKNKLTTLQEYARKKLDEMRNR